MGNTLSLRHRMYEGWLQTQGSSKYYGILNGTYLHIFESDVLIDEKPVKSINLIKYDKIKPIRFKQTDFKYGFRLKDKTKNRTIYGCKTRNECHEWITHIHYIIHHKMSAFSHDKTSNSSNKKDEIKNIYNILLEDYDEGNQKYIKNIFIEEHKKNNKNTSYNDIEILSKSIKETPCHSVKECRFILKLLLIDKIYRKWCQCYHKVRPYSMNKIITDILHYDISYLLDDYAHCIKYHSYIDIHNYLQRVPEYLCQNSDCSFLVRNYRDRKVMISTEDTHHCHSNEISNRIKLYLCVSDSFNVATMQILDKIHCYLLHSFINKPINIEQLKKTKSFGKLQQLNIINANDIRFNRIQSDYSMDLQEAERREKIWRYKNKKINKFVMNIEDNISNGTDDGKKDDYTLNGDDFDSGTLFTYYRTERDMEEKSQCGDALFKTPCSLSSRGSDRFISDDSNDGPCIDPKYKTFHEEITQNKVYKLSDLQYYDVYIISIYWMKTERMKNLRAKKHGLLNYKTGIMPGTPIGINHVMALLFYCNFPRLTNEFKKLFRSRNDDINKLYSNHSMIGHWSRYIYESIHLFGDIYNGNRYLYTSLNKEMLFNEWNIYLKAPISTTDDVYIINEFVPQNGIILKLTYKEPAKYFDLKILSDFYNEKEKLFINSRFSVQNIILSDGKELLDGMYSIELSKRILRGEVFSCFNKDLMNLKSQSILLHLMENYMMKGNKSNNKYNYSSSVNKIGLEYLCKIFKYMIHKQFKYNIKCKLSINIDEIKKLEKNLSLFCYNSDKKIIGSFIRDIIGQSTDNNIHNILYAVKYEFMVHDDKWNAFNQLKYGNTLKCGGFVYEMNENEKYIFNVEVGINEKQTECVIYIKLTSVPLIVDRIYIINDIVLKETRSERKYQKAYKRGDIFPISICKLKQCQKIPTKTLNFVLSLKIISTIYK